MIKNDRFYVSSGSGRTVTHNSKVMGLNPVGNQAFFLFDNVSLNRPEMTRDANYFKVNSSLNIRVDRGHGGGQ